MTLDVETPDPPRLRGPASREDYDAVDESETPVGDDTRREALAEFLRNGAWDDAFDLWREGTALTEDEFDLVIDLGLIEELDFYWNRADEDVGYRVPELPEDLSSYQRGGAESVDPQVLEEEVDDLGRTVSEVLENDYIHRGDDEFGFFANQ